MAASDSFVGEHLNPSPYKEAVLAHKEALARAELAEGRLARVRQICISEHGACWRMADMGGARAAERILAKVNALTKGEE